MSYLASLITDALEKAQAIADQFTRDDDAADIDALIVQLRAVAATAADLELVKDAAYLERNQVVAALAKAHPSGLAKTAIEGWTDDWQGCVFVDLPTGQASWHFHASQAYLFAGLPPYLKPWDGHTDSEKYERLAALVSERP